MDYNFREIEKKWQQVWKEEKVYQVSNDSDKPKCYVLDMFPYPSGAGLHVGHPLGYIASDIYARYKRLQGFNVLHPMGFDAFGLPAEQYAIETGQHPAVTTEKNIEAFKKQMNNIGFCYDWSREVRTSDPHYYKWTQWIFLQLFHSWYNRKNAKAESINDLIGIFEKEGNRSHPCPGDEALQFSAGDWQSFDEKRKRDILMNYRLAYCSYGEVNWCEALGTVLANDEVVNGVSERGGYTVVKKKLRQWYLRITEYADRLLEGLQKVDFSEAMKEMQSNWIGRSEGAEIEFNLKAPSRPSPKGKESQPMRPAYETAQSSLYHLTKEFSKENREKPTHEELLIWERLRNNQTGFHFRRQHIIGSFIVDFVCLKKKLTIEIDGGYHNNPDQKFYDEQRTNFLKENGYTELRFSNEEVRNNIDDVINRIAQKLNSLPSVEKRADAGKAFPSGEGLDGASMLVYTTRPDTIFGVDFMVLAPEHELVDQIKSPEQAAVVDEYVAYVKSRSERERMAEKKITGCFTGAYAIHPFNGKEIPVWISEYVLAGYGTGAIMAVPCGDERDYKFAKHFNIPITNIIGDAYNGEEANPTKEAVLQNSGFLNGLVMKDAIDVVINKLEEEGVGKCKINYKMRDSAFSRQRYWGEPFPIKWENGMAHPLDEKELPLKLPYVETYKPGPEGKGPLANIPEWIYQFSSPSGGGRVGALETNTMPGYAGSSWYFLRYMDPHNEKEFASRSATDYWNQVDVYVGGTEHAVGHLLYSRMWTKALYDLGYISFDEPYKKLINQGKITGKSFLVDSYIFKSKNSNNRLLVITSLNREKDVGWLKIIEGEELKKQPVANIMRLRNAHNYLDANGRMTKSKFEEFIKEEGENQVFFAEKTLVDWDRERITENGEPYLEGLIIEKMSKSKYNVINPDDIVEKYGADTFRMYEMFLGPIEQSKPWDTKGIEGVHRFLKKLWRLYSLPAGGEQGGAEASEPELRILHKTIKKVKEDTESFSFNTAVSQFMICVNELTALNCHKKEILEPLLILLTPYAPHISEELWHQLGNIDTILNAPFPNYDEKYIKEDTIKYPVAINGKTRTEMAFSADAAKEEVEKEVLSNEVVQKWTNGKPVKKFILVKGRMINVVV